GVIEYFADLGLLDSSLRLAHCVWISESDRTRLARAGAHVLHCPTSNLKLGSGIADVWSLLRSGINVSLGADGAACNNRLDVFDEMRLAALLPAYLHEPGAVNAEAVLDMATRGGARALGLDSEIGSLEVGKRADVVVLRADVVHALPRGASIADRIVYGAQSADVEMVIVDGRLLVDGGPCVRQDRAY